jgi:hypothetical protein
MENKKKGQLEKSRPAFWQSDIQWVGGEFVCQTFIISDLYCKSLRKSEKI